MVAIAGGIMNPLSGPRGYYGLGPRPRRDNAEAVAGLVFMAGLILLAIWQVWFEARNRDLITFAKLPKRPPRSSRSGTSIAKS